MVATYNGHPEVAKYLIEKGADVNHADKNGATALLGAAQEGHPEVAKYLIEKGADVNHADKDGDTALKFAAKEGHLEIAKYLIEKGADVNHIGKNGTTALTSVAQEGHLEIAKYLIEKGADVNHIGKDGVTAFMVATYKGHPEVAKYLIEKGADVNHATNHGTTALIFAVQEGHLEVAKYLIEKGVDVNYARKDGVTALMVATYKGHPEVAKYLIEKGADVNHANNNGTTALMSAAHNGHLEIAKYLIEKGADVNHADKDGDTALMVATYDGHLEIAKYLIEKGTDVDHKRKDGKTALDLAQSPAIKEVLKLISQLSHLTQDPNPAVRNRAMALVEAKKEVNSWLGRQLWDRKVKTFLINVQKGKYKNVAIEGQSERDDRILALMEHPDPLVRDKVEAITLIQDSKEKDRKLKKLEEQAAKSTARLAEAAAFEAQLKAKMRVRLKPLLTHENEQIRRGAEQLLYGEIGSDFEKKVCAFEAQAYEIEAQMKYKEELKKRLNPILTHPDPKLRQRAQEVLEIKESGPRLIALKRLEDDFKKAPLNAHALSENPESLEGSEQLMSPPMYSMYPSLHEEVLIPSAPLHENIEPSPPPYEPTYQELEEKAQELEEKSDSLNALVEQLPACPSHPIQSESSRKAPAKKHDRIIIMD